jgi:hypothetical protein
MSPFYFSHVTVDGYDQIISELQPYVKNFAMGLIDGFHGVNHSDLLDKCPSIKKWFSIKKLTVRYIGITKYKRTAERHIDCTGNGCNSLALNFNIQNCLLTCTKIFSCDKDPTLNQTPSGIPYWKFDPSTNFVQVAEFNLSTPVVFDTQVIHQVCNTTDETRISVSFRFMEDPRILLDN